VPTGYIQERIVSGAKVFPLRIYVILLRHIRDILGEDDSKASAQVPVNVAVEEPRARVVSEEPDRDIVASVADAYDVADDGVLKVV